MIEFKNGLAVLSESVMLQTENPLDIPSGLPITEGVVADIKVGSIRAIYPLIRAIHSNKLTLNYTLYSKNSLVGQNDIEHPTGMYSYVYPYPKPVILEHRLQDKESFFGPGQKGEKPLGRVVYAGYKKHPKDKELITPKEAHMPGYVEGDGALYLVPMITDEEAKENILGGIYHTVSVGQVAGKVVESVTGKDLIECLRKGEDFPPYERGQIVEVDGKKKLSYWMPDDCTNKEISYVNNPADDRAANVNTDIGESGLRLMVAEKKIGSNEFAFYDAKTYEKIELEESVYSIVDSAKVGQDIWWLRESADAAPVVQSKPVKYMQITNINSSLDDLKGLSQMKLSLEAEAQPKFLEDLEFLVNEKFKETGLTDEDVLALIDNSDEYEFEGDKDAFSQSSDLATEIYGELNENALKLAIVDFYQKGKISKLSEQLKPVTIGKLYNLDESNPLFMVESSITVKDFVEEAPVTNIQTAVIALLLKGDDEVVAEKAAKYGVALSNNEIVFRPVVIEAGKDKVYPITLTLDMVDDIEIDSLQLDASERALFNKFVEDIKDISLQIDIDSLPLLSYESQNSCVVNKGVDYLVQYYTQNESTEKELLQKLVGVVRKLQIPLSKIEEASQAYRHFGTESLRKLLTKPVQVQQEQKEEDPQPSISMIPNPLVAAKEQVEGAEKESDTLELFNAAYTSGRTLKK